jgi:hypothetical protein
MNIITVGIFALILFIVGFIMCLVIPLGMGCKTDAVAALKHSAIWMTAPVVVFVLLEMSPWVRSIFSQGVQSIFGWFKAESDQHSYDTLGMAWALVLAGLIMTTYIVHSLDVEVCKPDKSELQEFEEHLLKRHKEKASEEKVNKPDS